MGLEQSMAAQFSNAEDAIDAQTAKVVNRTLPILMSFMNAMTGKPDTGMVFLSLWCRRMGGFTFVLDGTSLAFNAGFVGQRAGNTWRKRVQSLEDLGFLHTAGENNRYIMFPDLIRVALDLEAEGTALGFQELLFQKALELGLLDEELDLNDDEEDDEDV